MDGSEAGDYTVDIKPGISFTNLAFNLTHEDMAKRELFGNLKFRQAIFCPALLRQTKIVWPSLHEF